MRLRARLACGKRTYRFPLMTLGCRSEIRCSWRSAFIRGSSGRVYPPPVIDKIKDDKAPRTYRLAILENEYVRIEIMPKIGGRIYRALDKTNGYDFVYYNRVIKPALVGLAGPWISGASNSIGRGTTVRTHSDRSNTG